ncbi:MAG TPA: Hpt domain-containing protein [Polyangiaceae bacterium]|nr:Hpt domain-containing protein [Polyangiaceae bacterium]
MGAQLRSPSRKIAPAILPTDADDFEEQLRLIRREYACKLPGKVSALAACLAEREKNLRVLAEARELAHRLKGTAGTYGFNGVAELAARLERSLSALVDDRAGGATLILKEIDELLAELRALAELEFENELASDPTNRPR